jgi:hypothetical protein
MFNVSGYMLLGITKRHTNNERWSGGLQDMYYNNCLRLHNNGQQNLEFFL